MFVLVTKNDIIESEVFFMDKEKKELLEMIKFANVMIKLKKK